MPNRYLSERRSALACSITLHAGLFAWLIWPHTTAEMPPQPQMVDISVVMISSLSVAQAEATPAVTNESTPLPPPEQSTASQIPTPPPKNATKKAEAKHEQKPEQKVASTPPTTGPQSPNATEKVAAMTKPIFNATSLHNPAPAYPDEARRRGIEGVVTLEVDVTPEGAAQDVTVMHSSGYALLDKAAHDTIRYWRFVPARRGDEIVEAKVTVPVEFKLE